MSNTDVRRKRDTLYRMQRGLCHWCKVVTRIITNEKPRKGYRPPPDMATLDHLDDRYSGERGTRAGERRIVLACWKCNNERNIARQATLPRAVLRAKCGRKPYRPRSSTGESK